MRRVTLRGVFLLSLTAVVALTAGACDDDVTPTTPTVTTTTEAFSGTLAQSGTASHSFNVSATGTVTISLTSLSPLTTMSIGLGIGSWDGSTCSAAMSKNDNARAGSTALTGTAIAGNYCVRVYDSGNIPADWTVTYEVSVVHP